MPLPELLDLIFRWTHLIAGIMWIGNSMLFNWLDRNLVKGPDQPRLSQGRIFMVHSGAFYDIEKKLLEPGELPARPEQLHWFKWQNGITWMSGISLLIVVYYFHNAAFLVDPSVRALSPRVAIALSVGSIVAAWLIYDTMWRAIGDRMPSVATWVSMAGLFGAAFGFAQLFSGRAAYMQTGVMMGTIMTGNVWLCIIPSQAALIAATRSGANQDPRLSIRAKARSIHNNYLTFPLLFIMLSSHFPSTYGHRLNWLILMLVMIGGAGVRHFMNIRYRGAGVTLPLSRWLAPAIACGLVALVGISVITRIRPASAAVAGIITFADVQPIIVTRCVPCHSAHPSDPTFPVAPANVMFDRAEQIAAMAPRIRERAVLTQTMPFLNKTQMTDAERAIVGKWIEDGAQLAAGR